MAIKRSFDIYSRGFTLIEVLFSLSICILIIVNAVPLIRTITYKDHITVNYSNYALGAKQLAQSLYTAKEITVGEQLSFKNEKDELFTITLHNNRIVKEPGFDIIIRDVEAVNFYQQEKNIYMQLNSKQQEFNYLIATAYQVEENVEEPPLP